MIVARYAEAFGHALIFYGVFEQSPRRELADMLPVKFLPWRLIYELRQLQLPAALRQLLIRDQNIGAALIQVDADAVAGA